MSIFFSEVFEFHEYYEKNLLLTNFDMAKIWWIGTGVMWSPMAGHLLAAGNQLFVYNRTSAKTQDLVSKWAHLMNSPAEVVQNSDIIFTIIGTPVDVEDMYFWNEGLLAHSSSGKILVDMTTTKPSLAQKMYTAGKEKWVLVLDAPVSGWDVWARNAALAIMVWWDREVYETILPYFELMGKNIVYEGAAWAGQHTKMCNQIAIAGSMIGMCESLVYAIKSWLDTQKVVDIISKWAAGSWSLENLAPRILRWELDTGFYVKHFVKDMWIALEEARNMNLPLPWLALVHQLYVSLIAEGGENLGTQGLIKVLKKMGNIN